MNRLFFSDVYRLAVSGIVSLSLLQATLCYSETPRVEEILSPSVRALSVSAPVFSSRLNQKPQQFARATNAEPPPGPRPSLTSTASSEVDLRGWNYVVYRLVEFGVPDSQLIELYSDPRMPQFEPIPFSVRPREPRSIYLGFTDSDRIALAKGFIAKHSRSFTKVEQRFGVNRFVIAALMLIESSFGKQMGTSVALVRLSRLIGLAEPGNITWNYERLKRDDPGVSFEEVHARAQYLESVFIKEIPALVSVARSHRIHPFNLKGSFAGALGIPQFLPSSYLNFAIDGDHDGVPSLFSTVDSIHSVANYLQQSGWKDSLSLKEKRAVIWKYNKSEEYITAVLKVAEKIRTTH